MLTSSATNNIISHYLFVLLLRRRRRLLPPFVSLPPPTPLYAGKGRVNSIAKLHLEFAPLTGGNRTSHSSSQRNLSLSTKVDAHAICLVSSALRRVLVAPCTPKLPRAAGPRLPLQVGKQMCVI